MTQQVYDHICRATKTSFPVDLWYYDAEVVASISEAAINGWVLRISTTQVEWTQKGVEAAKEMGAVRGHDWLKAQAELLLSFPEHSKSCTWHDVEVCFPYFINPVDEDYALWIESIKSQARQIYLLEKAGDKTENEAARAAIQFIHKKAKAK